MAQVKVTIGGRSYDLACHPGEEEHIVRLAGRIDDKVGQAVEAMGGMSEVRQLLLAALMLADDIEQGDPKASDAPTAVDAELADAIDRVAGRLEALADRLEKASAPS